MSSNSQSGQDIFTLYCTKSKRNGTYLELGSQDPVFSNNTYLLENNYGWRGIMVEYNPRFLPMYQQKRPNAKHIIQDATTIDYKEALSEFPRDIDFLQIDLEVNNRSTLSTLEKLENEVFPEHRFAVVCFEHDIYTGNHFDTRVKSREIFDRHGYMRVFDDISDQGKAYEDWYVHPSLVDMGHIMNLVNGVERDNVVDIDWKIVIKKIAELND